jgi:hypothetical protein
MNHLGMYLGRVTMKSTNFLRWILLPAVVFAAGIKAGIEYAKGTYVSKDRKFVEGEIIKDKKKDD